MPDGRVIILGTILNNDTKVNLEPTFNNKLLFELHLNILCDLYLKASFSCKSFHCYFWKETYW